HRLERHGLTFSPAGGRLGFPEPRRLWPGRACGRSGVRDDPAEGRGPTVCRAVPQARWGPAFEDPGGSHPTDRRPGPRTGRPSEATRASGRGRIFLHSVVATVRYVEVAAGVHREGRDIRNLAEGRAYVGDHGPVALGVP